MAKASPIQYSFNAGELSPRVKGRVDIPKYKNGCETMENFIPLTQGPVRKRPGTRFVNEVKTSANNARLIPFEFSTDQAYVLEFGDQYIRFYMDGGVIESSPSVPYEIASPYLHTELADIKFAQSADVMYIAHPAYSPRKLSRTGHTAWTLEIVDFDWVAFDDQNTDDTIEILASAATGVGITLTATSAIFSASMVNEYIRLEEVVESESKKWAAGTNVDGIAVGGTAYYEGNTYELKNKNGFTDTGSSPPVHTDAGVTKDDGKWDWEYLHSGAGYAKITGFTSTTVVTADVIKRLPESSLTGTGTKRWSEGAWSDRKGYPKALSFHEDRLWFAGSSNRPQTLWASTSGNYENHQYGTKDDDALNYTINSQEVNTIEWLVPDKQLTVGTSGGEFIVAASSADQAITPSNVRITPQTTFGCSKVQPYKIGNAVLIIQRSGRKLREFVYNFETDAYVAPDMAILADHILEAGVKEIAYQQEPNQIVWIVDNNGGLIGFTYERTEDVVAWHRHTISGSVESIVTIPHWDGDQDSTWMVVNRTINGSTVRYIEYIEKYREDDYSLFMDSALTYDGAPATSISGLDHLEGETVAVITDGAVHPDRTVSAGSITLQSSASIVNIGLGFTSTIKTMPIEAGAQDGIAQGKTKRITNLVVRLYNTAPSLHYGPTATDMDEYHTRGSTDLMDNPVPLFTGDTDFLPWPNGYEQEGQIIIEHRSALPCTITALMPQVVTNDR